MNKYTVYGNEELEKKIDSLMELIAGRLLKLSGGDLAALAGRRIRARRRRR
jgi:hypothetical protein